MHMEDSIIITIFKYYLSAFTALLPMVNPFSTVPLLLALTARMSAEDRKRQGDLAARNAVIILLIGLFMGGLILQFFNISLSALRVAGGIIISVIGLHMLFPKEAPGGGDSKEAAGTDASAKVDYSVIPLALPSLAGAGSLAVVMTFSPTILEEPGWGRRVLGYGIAVAAILSIGIFSFLILRAARWIQNYLGPQGINAMTRIMGLLMVCIGVQFIADGIIAFIESSW